SSSVVSGSSIALAPFTIRSRMCIYSSSLLICCGSAICISSIIKINEFTKLSQKRHFHGSCSDIPPLGNDQFDNARLVALWVVIVIPIKEGDDVRVLFDLSRFPDIGEERSFVLSLLYLPAKLRECDDGYSVLTSHDL